MANIVGHHNCYRLGALKDYPSFNLWNFESCGVSDRPLKVIFARQKFILCLIILQVVPSSEPATQDASPRSSAAPLPTACGWRRAARGTGGRGGGGAEGRGEGLAGLPRREDEVGAGRRHGGLQRRELAVPGRGQQRRLQGERRGAGGPGGRPFGGQRAGEEQSGGLPGQRGLLHGAAGQPGRQLPGARHDRRARHPGDHQT